MVRLVGETVDHDGAPWGPAFLMGSQLVLLVRISDLDGKKEVAAGIAPRQEVMAFGCSEVPLPFLLSYRAQAQRHLVHTHQVIAAIQVQLVLRLMNDDPIGELGFGRESAAGPQPTRPPHQTDPSTCLRKTAEAL